MWKQMILLLACIAAVCAAPAAAAEGNDTAIESQIQNSVMELDLSGWQDAIDMLEPELRSLFFDFDIDQHLSDTAIHGLQWENVKLENYFGKTIIAELKSQFGFFCTVIGICIAGAVVNSFTSSARSHLQEILTFIFYCFVVCLAIKKFSDAVFVGRETVKTVSGFIETVSPLIMTLLNTAGAVSGVGIIKPAMAVLTGSVTITLETFVIPLVLAGGVLSVLNNFTGRTQLEQLSRLTKSGTKWLLGLIFTLYTGVVTLQGLSIKAADGLSVRTAKFAADRFIPVVGGMVSGTLDTVLGCAILIKNAVGVTAILLVALLTAVPLMKIGISIFTFRIAAAVCEPVSDPRVPKMFAAISDMLGLLFAVIIVLCVMFVITTGLAIGMNGPYGGI